MAECHDNQRAFFKSLRRYNLRRREADTLEIGLLAALMGEVCERHVALYYPECLRL